MQILEGLFDQLPDRQFRVRLLTAPDEVLEEGEDLVLEGRGQRDDAPEDREEVLVMFAHEVRRDAKAVRRHALITKSSSPSQPSTIAAA